MKLKSALIFIFVTLLLFAIVFVNFFGGIIYNRYLLGLPTYFIPLLSVLIVIVIVLFFSSVATENDRLKYDFVTIVTHKFRTPITGLKWAISALRKDITNQEKEDLLRKMESTNDRLMEIVDLLVDSVKLDKRLSYAYEASSLREMVDAALQKYGEHIRRKNITFNIESGQDIPLIIIDKRKIQFAIDMLLDNAIKYTPTDGQINISLKQEQDSVLLSIRDSGIGIDQADLKHVFKRFFRSSDARAMDNEGMGLGLYSVKKIIERHSGKIWAESQGKGFGSTFHIQLKTK